MNIYFCHHKDAECGLYVVADTIGKAKALYAKWDGMESFTECRGQVIRKDVEVPAGVYDDNCAGLEKFRLPYDFYAEE